MFRRISTFAIPVLLLMSGLAVSTQAQLPAYPSVDTFEGAGHPGSPVWESTASTGLGWGFLSSVAGNGIPDFSYTGTILSGGPAGDYGYFDGVDGAAAVYRTIEAPFFGSFSFNGKVDNDPGTTNGHVSFWLSSHAGEFRHGRTPRIYLRNLGDGRIRMSMVRNADFTDILIDPDLISAGEWYTYVVNYGFGGPVGSRGEWTLKILDMAGDTVFDEGQVYHWNADSTVGSSVINWASFVKDPDSSDLMASPNWSIDEINTYAPSRVADFGIQRVREKDFLIMGTSIQPVDLQVYRDAGMNMVFVNNNTLFAGQMADAGEDYHFHFNPGLDWNTYSVGHRRDLHDLASRGGLENNTGIANFQAIMLPDEPQTVDDLHALAESNRWLHHFRPEVMTYVNIANSEDPVWIQQVIDIVKPDALSYSMYPALSASGVGVDGFDRNAMFRSTMPVRSATLAANIPFFVFLQSTDYDEYIPILDRQPSEAELRLNSWAPLAAGAKGVNYFAFTPDTGGGGFETFFFDSEGNTTDFYDQAASANAEIANVGQALRFLTSTDVRFVPGGVSITPDALTNWDANAGTGNILAIDINGAPEQDLDGLIGFFTDDFGGDYFMLVNMFTGASSPMARPSYTAEEAELDFTITFDEDVNAVWRLNRFSGQSEMLTLNNNMLNLLLPGGTGDLFKFGNGLFPGLETLPFLLGDFNLDGIISGLDIQGFIDAFTNEEAYKSTHGLSQQDFLAIADINMDSFFSGLDINPFVDLLTSGGVSQSQLAAYGLPEPAAGAVLCLLLTGVMARRRSRA